MSPITQGGLGEGNGQFTLRCSTCRRVYVVLNFTLKVGEIFQYEFPDSLVPCHADGFEVKTGEEDPWERVARMLNPDKEKNPKPKDKFGYSIDGANGIFYRVSIQRYE